MRLCLVGKYPPIEGGVSASNVWIAKDLAEHGFKVHVVTNGNEVEDAFRGVDLDAWLPEPLAPPPGRDGVTVHHTCPLVDAYIPSANPFVTKLSTLTTDVVRSFGCDLILGHYLEPYGMAAHLASRWTDVPYGLRHAGSDVGRLFHSKQLQTAYCEIIQRADYIFATPRTSSAVRALGVDDDRIYPALSPDLPTAYFHPNAPQLDIAEALKAAVSNLPDTYLGGAVHHLADKPFNPTLPTIGTYGKIGAVKGIYDLVRALGELRAGGAKFNFVAMMQGWPRATRALVEAIDATGIRPSSFILPFIPHWRVAGFIRSCTAVCFLERDFPIAIHGPAVPREVLACATCLVLSPEILNNPRTPAALRPNTNILLADPHDTDALVEVLRLVVQEPERAREIGRRGYEELSRLRGEVTASSDRLAELFREIHTDVTARRKIMSEAEMQATVARLCANDSFRRVFELEPDSTLDEYKLDPSERETLKRIDLKMLRMFAASLKEKRLFQVKALYPLIFRSLPSEEFTRYYERYYEMHPAFPGESQVEGAERFGKFLEESLATDPDVPSYAVDLVRYERLFLSASRAVRADDGFETINLPQSGSPVVVAHDAQLRLADGVQLGLFSCDVGSVVQQLHSHDEVEAPESATHAYVFMRMRNVSQPSIFRINLPMYFLLESCNGRRTPAELIADCEHRFDGALDEDSVFDVLADLVAKQLIMVSPQTREE